MRTKIIPVSVTPEAEKSIAYCARVSNPKNQDNDSFEGLLKYCIKHQHWSIFEHAFMTVEINTSLAIATQILRHRSFTFQQFSQRYADSTALQLSIPTPDLRRQDTKNRQNSIDDINPRDKAYMEATIEKHFDDALDLYNSLLKQGVAKECARMVLPQATLLGYTCLVVSVVGFTILNYDLDMEHSRSTRKSLNISVTSLLVSSQLFHKH